MIRVNSSVKLNMATIERLTDAAVVALEQTAEALHTEIVQAQVMPRDTGAMQGEKTFIRAGEQVTSTYKDGSTAVNAISKAKDGRITMSTSSPQARRLYFHPEYKFQKHENPNAKGLWFEDWEPGGKYEEFAEEAFVELYRRIADL